MNLTQKSKPRNFSDIVGHDITVNEIINNIKKNDVPQCTFIQGIAGTGKTTIAHVLAKALTCDNKIDGEPCNKCPDCLDIDNQQYSRSVRYKHGSNINIDEARQIENDAITFDISFSGNKIFIIDEIQEMALKSQAALKNLLLIMERHLPGVYFIFLTMSDFKVPSAIKGRTVYYKLHPVQFSILAKLLKDICENSGVKITEDKHEALFTIAQNSNGSPRDAIAYLDRVLRSNLWKLEDLQKELNLVADSTIIEIFNNIMIGNLKVLSYEFSDAHLKKLREFMILYLKGLNGFEYNQYQKKQFQGAKKFESKRILNVLDVLNSVCEYGYVDQTLIDTIFIKAMSLGGV